MPGLWYRFASGFVRIFYFGTHGGLKAIDEHNVPSEGPVIIAPVHVSLADPPAIACTCRRAVHPMAKEELFKGILGWTLKSLGAFPVRRGEGDTEAIRTAMEYLDKGEVLLLFPEGTRNDGVTMGPMNRGVTMLAKRGNAAVVPVGIVGSNIVLPPSSSGQKGKKALVKVIYGKPFTYADCATGSSERENRELFAAELEKRILELCAQHGFVLKSSVKPEDRRAARPR